MNPLEQFFRQNNDRLIHKWHHYFEIYHRHFERFRGKEVHIVEFGVFQGGSLRMWRDYFGDNCHVYGVDINPHCKTFEEDGIKIFIGDQANKRFLRQLAQDIPRIDILLDDGGHTMRQQKNTFKVLFPRIDANGVYLCEDLHTSYWLPWGGGLRNPYSFIEFSKRHIDKLNAWHVQGKSAPWYARIFAPFLRVSEFTRSAHSMHYYDSVLVIEKRPVSEPIHSATGVASVPVYYGGIWWLKNKVWRLLGKGGQ